MDAETVDTIVCPACHAELAATEEVCGHCGAATTGKRSPQPLFDRPWVIVVLLLHVGLLGIPFYWQSKYSLATRLLISLASIIYTLLAVAFIAWMLHYLYSVFWG